MGIRAYKVELHECALGGGSDFYDLLEKHFTNDDGEVYIAEDAWDEFITENIRELIPRYRDEILEVRQDIRENGGSVSYVFL